ncbi:uncharacterized protein LOC129731336 isoform X2 [Wyeomyia smithii]|uniref:uncharacterized protein LOC129731336 isoform X2 n=1 Tax=Wyeomyia smithii TaxID=174621 RepID=UPI0024680FB7|nr:uncharacterized protein LOC129731336 isoform X2 [Wyeomyia smithii]
MSDDNLAAEEASVEKSLLIYVGNLQKTATEDQLRDFFRECKGIQAVEFRLENCTYCPTKIAFIKFTQRSDANKALRFNQNFFQGRRLFITNVDSERNFTPRYSVMVRQLNEYITEEDIYEHFRNIGTIECVQKPANNYAYISFERSEMAQRALRMKDRNLKGVEVEICTIKRTICMLLEKPKKMQFTSIASKCEALGLRYEPQAESVIKLLVTNIPRHVPEKDIVDYFEKFGKVVDWETHKSPISVLTNIGYVTYLNSNTARYVYLYGPHYFQGVALDIYNPRITYGEHKSTTAVLIKRTSIYLTNDEIFQAMNECGRVVYIHRVDATRFCTVVRFQFYIAVKQALSVKQIAQENVYVTKYTDQDYLTDMAPLAEVFPKSSIRIYKEAELRRIIDMEDRAEMLKLRTEPNPLYLNPNPEFYKNEVQILNFPSGIGIVQLREHFKKYGNVINFREVSQGFVRIGYVSFDTRLGARRACSMNQNFINGKRLLIHLATENLVIDPAVCVNVTGLNPSIADEEIYDQFNEVGTVKFVLRKSAERAVVCMEQPRWLEPALQIRTIGRFKVIVNRMSAMLRGPAVQQFEAPPKQSAPNRQSLQPSMQANQSVPKTTPIFNPMTSINTIDPTKQIRPTNGTPNRPMERPNAPMRNANAPMSEPSGQMMCPNGHVMDMRGPMMDYGGPQGPMMRPQGPMMRPQNPMMGPQGPMMRPQGPMMGQQGPMMGPQGPMIRPSGPMMGPPGSMMGPQGPMMGPQGPMMGQQGPMMGPQGPMMGPQGPMMGPQGPMMGPQGPMMGRNGPNPVVTPAMKRLMQIVESNMIHIQAFASLPMIDQFRLVHGIVNQFQDVPSFIHMKTDKKINYLISGNGFKCPELFTLFTYPQQLKLLNLIQTDYLNTSMTPDYNAGPPIMKAPVAYTHPVASTRPVVSTHPVAKETPVSQKTIQEELETSGSLAPWQLKPSRTSTGSNELDFQNKEPSAQDRFEKEQLQLQSSLGSPPQLDDVPDTLSISSESSFIPPAPEPPKFLTSNSPLRSPPIDRADSRSPINDYLSVRSMSISPINIRRSRSNSRNRLSPAKRESLSPLSKALFSTPIETSSSRTRHRHETSVRSKARSRSRSPNLSYRSRRVSPPSRRDRYARSPSRSPEFIRVRGYRSRSPERRSYRRSPVRSLSPPSRSKASLSLRDSEKHPTWDDEILQDKKRKLHAKEESGASSEIYVGNLPPETNDGNVVDIFGKFGQIVKITLITVFDKKKAFIKFDTFDQAVRALEMHLRIYRGNLLRVAFINKKQRERPGYSVSVASKGPYDEVVMYDTFKMCGEITNIWTRIYMNTTYCVIDFKHHDAVRAAMDTDRLITGQKCKCRAIV